MVEEIQRQCFGVAIDAAPIESTELALRTGSLPGSSHRLTGAEYSALHVAKSLRAALGGSIVALCIGEPNQAVLTCNEALLRGVDAAYILGEATDVLAKDPAEPTTRRYQKHQIRSQPLGTAEGHTSEPHHQVADPALLAAAAEKLGIRYLFFGDYSRSGASGSFALRSALATRLTLLSGVESLEISEVDTIDSSHDAKTTDTASSIEVHLRLNESVRGVRTLPLNGAVLSCHPVHAQPEPADLDRRVMVQRGKIQPDYLTVCTSSYRSPSYLMTQTRVRQPPNFRPAPTQRSSLEKTAALLDVGSTRLASTRHTVHHLSPQQTALRIVENLRNWAVLEES